MSGKALVFFICFAVVGSQTINYTVTNNGNSAYRFSGSDRPLTGDNPNFYVVRGEKIIFTMIASGHPFQLEQSSMPYMENQTVTGNRETGVIEWDVTAATPASLDYVCTIHPSMTGVIAVLDCPPIDFCTTVSCSGPGNATCDECNTGYYANNTGDVGVCEDCPANCQTCSATGNGTCFTCEADYSVVDGTCEADVTTTTTTTTTTGGGGNGTTTTTTGGSGSTTATTGGSGTTTAGGTTTGGAPGGCANVDNSCGGACSPCANGLLCGRDTDCDSGYCSNGGTCEAVVTDEPEETDPDIVCPDLWSVKYVVGGSMFTLLTGFLFGAFIPALCQKRLDLKKSQKEMAKKKEEKRAKKEGRPAGSKGVEMTAQ